MRHSILFALLALPLLVLSPALASAQVEWRPPTTSMPMMPSAADLQGNWMSSNAQWFNGVEAVSGVATSQLRAGGDRRRGSDRLQIVRFGAGPLPAVVWSDRNGDDRADMIEIYRSGGVIVQLIDADYDGRANVMRVYDARGTLLREERL
jgi:hypothetical protein